MDPEECMMNAVFQLNVTFLHSSERSRPVDPEECMMNAVFQLNVTFLHSSERSRPVVRSISKSFLDLIDDEFNCQFFLI